MKTMNEETYKVRNDSDQENRGLMIGYDVTFVYAHKLQKMRLYNGMRDDEVVLEAASEKISRGKLPRGKTFNLQMTDQGAFVYSISFSEKCFNERLGHSWVSSYLLNRSQPIKVETCVAALTPEVQCSLENYWNVDGRDHLRQGELWDKVREQFSGNVLLKGDDLKTEIAAIQNELISEVTRLGGTELDLELLPSVAAAFTRQIGQTKIHSTFGGKDPITFLEGTPTLGYNVIVDFALLSKKDKENVEQTLCDHFKLYKPDIILNTKIREVICCDTIRKNRKLYIAPEATLAKAYCAQEWLEYAAYTEEWEIERTHHNQVREAEAKKQTEEKSLYDDVFESLAEVISDQTLLKECIDRIKAREEQKSQSTNQQIQRGHTLK